MNPLTVLPDRIRNFLQVFVGSRSARRRRLVAPRPAAAETLEPRILLAAGSLDASFGYQFFNWNGRNAVWYGNNETNVARLRGLLLQADGKIVIGGDPGRSYAGIDVVRLNRYDTDGQLDRTFGSHIGQSGNTFDVSVSGRALALQTDGKILVAGDAFVKEINQTVVGVQRLLTGPGQRDPSFGTGEYGQLGAVFLKVAGDASAAGLAVQPDGKIVMLFGRPQSGKYARLGLVRFNSNGSIDNSFGNSGTLDSARGVIEHQPFAAGFEAAEASLVVQPDGKLLVGASTVGSGSDFVLMRLNGNGTLDTTFDGDGIVTTDFGGDDELSELKLQSDGRILAVGKNETGPADSRFALARYHSNGSLDSTFDADGKVTTAFAGGYARGRGLALQADGKIVAVGAHAAPAAFALARYRTDGTLDTSFDIDGRATTVFPLLTAFPAVSPSQTQGYNWEAERVAIQPDGRIVVAGDGLQGFAIARYEAVTTGPGFAFSRTSGLVTTEAFGPAGFSISLNTQPAANVTIQLSSSDTTEGVINSATTLTFTRADWNVPQSVLISGVDDSLRDFNQNYEIVTSAAVSGDPTYNGIDPPDVSVTNDDDESLQMFRTYNSNANFHFFTTSRPQFDFARENGYSDESTGKAGFAVLPSAVGEALPIYRLYHLVRGFHYYTTSAAEKDFLLTQETSPGVPGWRYESVEGYMFAAGSTESETTTVYRLYNRDSGVHLFTENEAYKNQVLALFPNSWVEHNPLGRAFGTPAGGASGAAAIAVAAAAAALLEPVRFDPHHDAGIASKAAVAGDRRFSNAPSAELRTGTGDRVPAAPAEVGSPRRMTSGDKDSSRDGWSPIRRRTTADGAAADHLWLDIEIALANGWPVSWE